MGAERQNPARQALRQFAGVRECNLSPHGRHEDAPFVPALRDRVRRIMETGNGLETRLTHSSPNSSQVEEKMAAGPVSRILSALRRDGHSSGPRITARLKRPTRRLWRAEPARVPGKAEASLGNPSLFGLAPCGVCPARRITASAVRSYRTFSPLPEPCGPGGMFSVALSVERSRP